MDMPLDYDKWLLNTWENDETYGEGETLIADIIRDFELKPGNYILQEGDPDPHCHWCGAKDRELYRLEPINDMLCCNKCSILNYL